MHPVTINPPTSLTATLAAATTGELGELLQHAAGCAQRCARCLGVEPLLAADVNLVTAPAAIKVVREWRRCREFLADLPYKERHPWTDGSEDTRRILAAFRRCGYERDEALDLGVASYYASSGLNRCLMAQCGGNGLVALCLVDLIVAGKESLPTEQRVTRPEDADDLFEDEVLGLLSPHSLPPEQYQNVRHIVDLLR